MAEAGWTRWTRQVPPAIAQADPALPYDRAGSGLDSKSRAGVPPRRVMELSDGWPTRQIGRRLNDHRGRRACAYRAVGAVIAEELASQWPLAECWWVLFIFIISLPLVLEAILD